MLWLTKLEVLMGLLPGLAWLAFFMQEDPDGEPKRVIAKTFFLGALFAFFALFFQLATGNLFDALSIGQRSIIALVLLALIEELFKFGGVYYAIHGNPAFDVPVDAMVYMVVGALGFATVENLGAVATSALGQGVGVGAFETATFRFVGATLLHATTSAIIGYHWGLALLAPKRRWLLIGGGLVLATVLHAAFNYLILSYGNLMYAVVFVVGATFFVLRDFDRLNQRLVNIQG